MNTTYQGKLNRRRTKLNNFVEFPFELDMKKYTKDFLSGNVQSPDSYYNFSLRGIIVHEGRIDYGHYFSIIKQGDEWFEFNDSDVKPYNIKNLKNDVFGGPGSKQSAYILFYERKQHFDKKRKHMEDISAINNVVFRGNQGNILKEKNELMDQENAEFVTNLLSEESCLTFIRKSKEMLGDNNDLYFSCLFKYIFLYRIRDQRELDLKEIYPEIVTLLQDNLSCSLYLLKNLCNAEVFLEFLVLCPEKEKRLIFYGLIKEALETVNYLFNDLDNNQYNIVIDFINRAIHCVNLSISFSLNSNEMLFVLEDLLNNDKLREVVKDSDLYILIKNFYIINLNQPINFFDDLDSDLIQLPKQKSNFTAELTIADKKSYEGNNFKQTFFRMSCLFFQHNFRKSLHIVKDIQFWIKNFDEITNLNTIPVIMKTIKVIKNNDIKIVEDIIKSMIITADNYKVVFSLYMQAINTKSEEIMSSILKKISDLINHSGLLNYYFIFDSLVRVLSTLSGRNEEFRIKLNNSLILSDLDLKNNECAPKKAESKYDLFGLCGTDNYRKRRSSRDLFSNINYKYKTIYNQDTYLDGNTYRSKLIRRSS